MSRFRTDAANCIDIERTCWEGEPPAGMRSETIQIGLVDVDIRDLSIGRMERYYVRPRSSTVSEYCTRLTGITPETLKTEGRPLAEVMRTILKNWGPKHKTLLAWGNDWTAIDAECAEAGCENPFPQESALDIGKAFTLMHGAHASLGLYAAMEACGVEASGRKHDGMDDAANAARLFLHFSLQLRNSRPVSEDKFGRPWEHPGSPGM